MASVDKKPSHGDQCKMLLPDLASVIVGSAILVGLFVSISYRRPKTIIALNNKWQKTEVMV
ncbi:MAG: hypothetical protein ACJ70M_03595 [Nitrososphaera sp.]